MKGNLVETKDIVKEILKSDTLSSETLEGLAEDKRIKELGERAIALSSMRILGFRFVVASVVVSGKRYHHLQGSIYYQGKQYKVIINAKDTLEQIYDKLASYARRKGIKTVQVSYTYSENEAIDRVSRLYDIFLSQFDEKNAQVPDSFYEYLPIFIMRVYKSKNQEIVPERLRPNSDDPYSVPIAIAEVLYTITAQLGCWLKRTKNKKYERYFPNSVFVDNGVWHRKKEETNENNSE